MADHDPARTRRDLQEFSQTMRALFIDGYVLCDAQHDVPHLGPAKTISQVAMEQCREMKEFHYGTKVWTLWGQTSHKECTESMAAISTVVQDMLARLEADFHSHDLYMSFGAMDVAAWLPWLGESHTGRATCAPSVDEPAELLQGSANDDAPAAMRGESVGLDPQGASDGSQPPALMALRRLARRLCEGVGVKYSYLEWQQVLRDALPGFRKEQARLQGVAEPDLRALWARTLGDKFSPWNPDAPFGSWTWVAPVIAFYISCLDTTGEVERGLGKHAAYVSSHVGAQEGDVSWSEACLEIACEGPASEDAFFVPGPSDSGMLLLNEFSRNCAKLWVTLNGRRFGCYKARVDRKKGGTGLRLKGSMVGIQRLQHAAVDQLVKVAAADSKGDGPTAADSRLTVLGTQRSSVARGASRLPPLPATKSMENFRRYTDIRNAEKKAVPVWVGHKPGAPKLRPRVSQPKPKGRPRKSGYKTSPLVASAQRWLSRASAVGKPQQGPASRTVPVIVQSRGDLVTSKPTAELLEQWLCVVAMGGTVRCGSASTTYAASSKQHPAQVHLTRGFQQKHRSLTKSLRKVFGKPDVMWSEAPAVDQGGKVFNVDTANCLRRFLVEKRCLAQPSRVGGGAYGDLPSKRPRLSRYGHATIQA